MVNEGKGGNYRKSKVSGQLLYFLCGFCSGWQIHYDRMFVTAAVKCVPWPLSLRVMENGGQYFYNCVSRSGHKNQKRRHTCITFCASFAHVDAWDLQTSPSMDHSTEVACSILLVHQVMHVPGTVFGKAVRYHFIEHSWQAMNLV